MHPVPSITVQGFFLFAEGLSSGGLLNLQRHAQECVPLIASCRKMSCFAMEEV